MNCKTRSLRPGLDYVTNWSKYGGYRESAWTVACGVTVSHRERLPYSFVPLCVHVLQFSAVRHVT